MQKLLIHLFSQVSESVDCWRIDVPFFFRIWHHGRKFRKNSLLSALGIAHQVSWVDFASVKGNRCRQLTNAAGMILHALHLQRITLTPKDVKAVKEIVAWSGIRPCCPSRFAMYVCQDIVESVVAHWTNLFPDLAHLVFEYAGIFMPHTSIDLGQDRV